MEDFDQFLTNNQTQETDPVVDFLVREQKQLAELNDFDDLASATPDATTAPEVQVTESVNSNSDPFTLFQVEDKETYEQISIVNADLRGMDDEQFEDRYAALNEEGPPRIETDKMLKWQDDQKKRLVDKDTESEKKQKEWLQQARLELDEYYKHREDLLNKAKKSNKEAEEVFVHDRDDKKQGAEWERVCRMCDFNPKSSTRGCRDVSRLRSLLLQLKQTPNVSFAA